MILNETEAHELEKKVISEHRKELVNSKKFIGIALSGGGLRAAAFHIGFIENGFFKFIDYIASASGGSFCMSAFMSHYEHNIKNLDKDITPEQKSINETKDMIRKNISFIFPDLISFVKDFVNICIACSHNFIFICCCIFIMLNLFYKDLDGFDDINETSKVYEYNDCAFEKFSPYLYRVVPCYIGIYSIFNDIKYIETNTTDIFEMAKILVGSYKSSIFLNIYFWIFVGFIVIISSIFLFFTSIYVHNCLGNSSNFIFNTIRSSIVHFFCNCCGTVKEKVRKLDDLVKEKEKKEEKEEIDSNRMTLSIKKVAKVADNLEEPLSQRVKRFFKFIMISISIFIFFFISHEIFNISLYAISYFIKMFNIDILGYLIVVFFCFIICVALFYQLFWDFFADSQLGLYGAVPVIASFGIFLLSSIIVFSSRLTLWIVYGVGMFGLNNEYILYGLEIFAYVYIFIEICFSKIFYSLLQESYRFKILRAFFRNQKDIVFSKLSKRPYNIFTATVNNLQVDENEPAVNSYRKKHFYHSYVITPLMFGSQVLDYIQFPFSRIQFLLSRASTISSACVSISMGLYNHTALPQLVSLSSDISRRFLQILEIPQSKIDQYQFVSDAGHFDLSGIYELIKRKVEVIFAFDIGLDMFQYSNDMLYKALTESINEGLIEKDIHVDNEDNTKTVLNISRLNEKKKENTIQVTKDNFIKFTIKYKDSDRTSIIYYAKASVTGKNKENMLIHLYSLLHSDFPQEKNSSFQLTKEQVDMYELLGEIITKDVVEDFYASKTFKNYEIKSTGDDKSIEEEEEEITVTKKNKNDENDYPELDEMVEEIKITEKNLLLKEKDVELKDLTRE